MGTEYIVGGVVGGRLILPQMRQRSWCSFISSVSGGGGYINVLGVTWLEASNLVAGRNNMDLTEATGDCKGTRKPF